MVSINYSLREVCCKIVYYGPGLSGKTTNLQYVHSKVPGNARGDLISLATEADRTLYFDFLPINIGSINGFAAKFQLYTVPGQVYYNATRKLVLRGVDGVVFVADSQSDKLDENIEALLNLEDNLREYGYSLDDLPFVIQYNKRDLPGVMSVEDLDARLNKRGWPSFEASATIGNGVFGTLKLIIKLVLDKAKKGKSSQSKSVVASDEAMSMPQSQVVSNEGMPRVPATVVPVVSAAVTSNIGSDLQAPAVATVESPTSEPTPSVPERGLDNSDYRPYPGEEEAETTGTKMSPGSFAPSQTSEQDGEASLERNVVKPEIDGKGSPSPELPAPIMTPSLRRGGTGKKRGFFKRLFGIR